MTDWLQDPAFFYAVAFTTFVVLALIFGRRPALDWIDGQIAEIRAELDQAHQLRAEAEAALAACKERQAAAEAEARDIMASTRRQVEAMRVKAQSELDATIARHQQMAEDHIRLAEQEALREVREAAIELAISMARRTLSTGIDATDAAGLIDGAIDDLAKGAGQAA